MKRSMPSTVLCLLLFSLGCFPSMRATKKTFPLSTLHERIWIAPLINNSGLSELDIWPKDSLEQSLLSRYFIEMEERLVSELRRCQKYGLFEVVDDSGRATFIIRPQLLPGIFLRPTLSIPFTLEVELLPIKKNYSFPYTIKVTSTPRTLRFNSYHYCGTLLAEYRNAIPYRSIGKLFCP